jgi:hypothetical protein
VRQIDSIEKVVERAIATLNPEVRAMLDGTAIVIEPVPSARQVNHEIEPRQVVLAEGIDARRASFKKLWIFYGNLLKAGVSPHTIDSELAKIILHELTDIDPIDEESTV